MTEPQKMDYAKRAQVWLCTAEKFGDKGCGNYIKREYGSRLCHQGLCKYRRTYINDKTRRRFSICEYPRTGTPDGGQRERTAEE